MIPTWQCCTSRNDWHILSALWILPTSTMPLPCTMPVSEKAVWASCRKNATKKKKKKLQKRQKRFGRPRRVRHLQILKSLKALFLAMRPSESVGPSREKLFPVPLAPNAKTTEGIPCGPLCREYRELLPYDSDIIWDLQVLLCDVWSCLLIRMLLLFAWVEQLWEALQLVAMRHHHTDSDWKQIKYDSQHNMACSFSSSNMFQLQTTHDATQLDQHRLTSGFFFETPAIHWPKPLAF